MLHARPEGNEIVGWKLWKRLITNHQAPIPS